MINLNKRLAKVDRISPSFRKPKRRPKFIKILVVLLVLVAVFVLPARGVYTSAQVLSESSKKIIAGAKSENLDLIKQGTTETKDAIKGLKTSLTFFFWLRFIPFVGGYYSDGRHFLNAAEYEINATEIVVNSLDPYKVELGLTGQAIAGQDRVAQGLKVLEKVLPELDKIEPNLKKAREEVEKVNTDKYPESFRGKVVKSRLVEAKDLIIGAHVAITEGKDALKQAPSALGQNSSKTYLLLFQNDKELRATGGFLTAYAFLNIDKGRLSTTASDDIYRLDERLLNVCKTKICPLAPPAPIVKYLPEFDGKPRTAWSMRDSNLSPDLSTSMKEFEKMYQLLGEGLKYDGIITIDTQVVEELIAITGPIDVFGTKYSADIDQRCNCPNVIYELERYAEITAKGEGDRKAILGTLMQQLLAKSLGIDPQKMPNLLQTGIKLAQHKHVMFYMHDNNLQQALGNLNWTGQVVKDTSGDYLHINDSNFAGGKTNIYVTQDVLYEVNIKDGKSKVKLSIEYKNPQPFSSWLNTINRDYVRIYAPKGSRLVSSKGSDDPVKQQEDQGLNKTYFEAFVTVRPENSRKLEFEYELPISVSGNNYPLLIQKQPGAKDHHYTIKINGREKEKFNLEEDKELSLDI